SRLPPGRLDAGLGGASCGNPHDPQRCAPDPLRGGRRRRAALARVVGRGARRGGLFCARHAPGLRARRIVRPRRISTIVLALGCLALFACEDGNQDAPPAATSTATATPPAVVTAAAPPPAPPPPPPKPSIALASEGPPKVVDLHVDTPWRVHFKGREVSLPEGHATPDRLEKGRYAALVYPIYIPDYIHDSH